MLTTSSIVTGRKVCSARERITEDVDASGVVEDEVSAAGSADRRGVCTACALGMQSVFARHASSLLFSKDKVWLTCSALWARRTWIAVGKGRFTFEANGILEKVAFAASVASWGVTLIAAFNEFPAIEALSIPILINFTRRTAVLVLEIRATKVKIWIRKSSLNKSAFL